MFKEASVDGANCAVRHVGTLCTLTNLKTLKCSAPDESLHWEKLQTRSPRGRRAPVFALNSQIVKPVCVQIAACKVLFAGGRRLIWRQLLTRPSVLCHHNIPVTAKVTYAKHQLSKMAMVGWGGGNNREKTNIRVRLQKGGKNIQRKLDPSGAKVVCDCIFCSPRLLFNSSHRNFLHNSFCRWACG